MRKANRIGRKIYRKGLSADGSFWILQLIILISLEKIICEIIAIFDKMC